MTDSTTNRFVRCEPIETAAGWLYGMLPSRPLPREPRDARAALDDAIRPFLLQTPCYVTFSGGRDSSAVLAAATSLARREGHPLPIPVTRVYPDLPETDESDWQRAVVDHLELPTWLRLEFRAGETDLLGPAARVGIRSRGPLWPPAMQTFGAMFEKLGRGALITGEGGDAVLGARRGAALAMLRQGRRPILRIAANAAYASAPGPMLRRRMLNFVRGSVQHRWLRPAALEEHAKRITDDTLAEPLCYDKGTWLVTRRRSFAVIRQHHAAIAAEYGIRASDPLLDPGFVAALAHQGGRLGFTSRTAVMRALFSEVLPDAVLARTSKASFNRAHRTNTTREFALTWDGSGVDEDLVDTEKLRDVWLSDSPTMATGILLHNAWLASQSVSMS